MGGEGMEEKERRTGRAGKRSAGGGYGKQMQATCYKGACPHRCADTPTLSNEVFEGDGGLAARSSSLDPHAHIPTPTPPHPHRGNLGFRVRGQCTKRTKKKKMEKKKKKKKKKRQQQGHKPIPRPATAPSMAPLFLPSTGYVRKPNPPFCPPFLLCMFTLPVLR